MSRDSSTLSETSDRNRATQALFEKEIDAGSHFDKLLEESASMPGNFAVRLSEVSRYYRRLLRQAMTLTRVSDTTQLDLVRTSQALSDALQRVQRLNEEKDNLIAMAAHDLRTPLSGIRGLASMIEAGGESGADPKHLAGEISQCSERLLQMISNLLELHRLETTSLRQQPIELGLDAIAKSIADSFSPIAAQKQITLKVGIGGDGPAPVCLDVLLFMRVADNLISNALKYSPPGCPVEVELSRREDRLVIAVKDEGPGISETDQTRLFEKFVRLSARPTAGEPSTGLGLALAHSIASALGGTIRCDSTLGMGSTFTAEFPLAQPASV